MFQSLRGRYRSVPSSDLSEEFKDTYDTQPEPPKRRDWSLLALATCLAATIANIMALRFAPGVPSTPDINRLRRPSQFIGLDKIVRPTPPIPRQFDNFPFLVSRTDSQHQDKVLGVDEFSYMSTVGTITPELYRIQVSNSISTIVQFRAIDFGMEKCRLSIVAPASVPPTAHVAVYRLDVVDILNEREINYYTRPGRLAKLAELEMTPSTNWTRYFSCQSDGVYTFELACSEQQQPCDVQWVQDKKESIGVFITQFATV